MLFLLLLVLLSSSFVHIIALYCSRRCGFPMMLSAGLMTNIYGVFFFVFLSRRDDSHSHARGGVKVRKEELGHKCCVQS